MESPKAEMASVQSPPEDHSRLSSLLHDISQQMQEAMKNMLKMTNEIDQNSAEVMEEIEKSKDYVLQRKQVLEEEKEQLQQAAFAVWDLLNKRA